MCTLLLSYNNRRGSTSWICLSSTIIRQKQVQGWNFISVIQERLSKSNAQPDNIKIFIFALWKLIFTQNSLSLSFKISFWDWMFSIHQQFHEKIKEKLEVES